MNQKKVIIISVMILVLSLVPIRTIYKDGGTRCYSALLYKVIVWNRLMENDERYQATEVHFFPNNFHSLKYYAPPTLPSLLVIYEKQSLVGNLGSYHWRDTVDGKTRSVISDGISVLEMQYSNTLEILSNAVISFPALKGTIVKGFIYGTHYSMNNSLVIQDQSISLNNLENGQSYVIDLEVQYEQGIVHYSFKVQVLS